MNIAGYHRAVEKLMRDMGAVGPMPVEWDNTPPFNLIESIELTTESGPDGYALFLAQKYMTEPETKFIQAKELRRGMVIVERGVRGKKTKHPVADAYHTGEYGHGHIVVSVSRQLWRYEPESIVEID